MAAELKGTIKVAKVDAKDPTNKALLHRFGISILPTMILIKDGVAHMTKGPLPKTALLLFAQGGYEQNPPHLNYPVPPVVLPEDVPPEPVFPEEHTGPSDVVTLTDANFEHMVGCQIKCIRHVFTVQSGSCDIRSKRLPARPLATGSCPSMLRGVVRVQCSVLSANMMYARPRAMSRFLC